MIYEVKYSRIYSIVMLLSEHYIFVNLTVFVFLCAYHLILFIFFVIELLIVKTNSIVFFNVKLLCNYYFRQCNIFNVEQYIDVLTKMNLNHSRSGVRHNSLVYIYSWVGLWKRPCALFVISLVCTFALTPSLLL